MPNTKHLPIQPYPASGHSIATGTATVNPTPIMIAPSTRDDNTHCSFSGSGNSRSSSSGGSANGDGHSKKSTGSTTGLTIRTSRHWVLPPRPKPGRKPNHNQQSHDTHNHYHPQSNTSVKRKPVLAKEIATPRSSSDVELTAGKTSVVMPAPVAFKKDLSKLPIKNINPPTCLKATTISPPPSITPITSPSPSMTKKQTKAALKKEINNIKVQNTKLKQELGLLVGNLQDLKRKYNTKNLTAAAKTKPAKLSNKKKRHYLDDSTLAFLKFEEEDDNEGDVLNEEENKNGEFIESDPVMLPPLLISNAKMNLTSSISSCKTILTDDEDILTMSSSTPNSLFSSDLQPSSSLSSASSLNLNTNNGCNAHLTGDYHSPVCTNTNSKNANHQLKFLDGYEQMAFYDKYMRMDLNLPSEIAMNTNISDSDNNIGLDSIKEEEIDCKFYDNNNDNNILDFIQLHNNNDNKFIKNELPPFNDNDNKDTKPCDLFFNIKQESDDLFQTLSLDNNQTITTTTSASSNTNYYLPPSLEELMEEQDGGVAINISEKCFKNLNFSMMTNNINDLTLMSANDCDDDFDMLKVEVFDMV